MKGFHQSSSEGDDLIIRPLRSLAEHRILCNDPASWYARRVDERHHVIIAVDGEDVVGGCAVEDVDRHWPHALVIAALEAKEPEVAQALLNEIWRRAAFIVAEDVPPECEAWWRAQRFERSAVWPPMGESGRLDMSRIRWDHPGDEEPLEPFWPASTPLGRLLRQTAGW